MNKMFEDSLLILAMIKNLVADGKPNGLSLLSPLTRSLLHLVSCPSSSPPRDPIGRTPTRFLPKWAPRRLVRCEGSAHRPIAS